MTIYLCQEYRDIYIRDYLEFIIGIYIIIISSYLVLSIYLKERIKMISYTPLGIKIIQLQKVILYSVMDTHKPSARP